LAPKVFEENLTSDLNLFIVESDNERSRHSATSTDLRAVEDAARALGGATGGEHRA
jgi:hypothetical protein